MTVLSVTFTPAPAAIDCPPSSVQVTTSGAVSLHEPTVVAPTVTGADVSEVNPVPAGKLRMIALLAADDSAPEDEVANVTVYGVAVEGAVVPTLNARPDTVCAGSTPNVEDATVCGSDVVDTEAV